MTELLVQLVGGITYGGILLLISLGLTIVFGIGRVINFAHGILYALGAFLGVSVAEHYGFFLALVICPLIVALISAVIDSLLLRRIREKPMIITLIVTFGILLILSNGISHIWGTTVRFVELPLFAKGSWELMGGRIAKYQILAATVSISVASLMLLGMYKTKLGVKLRAASEDPDKAELVGINVNRLFSIVFALGGGLAAFAGVISAPQYGAVLGMEDILVYIFVIIILGGLGSLRGTVVASFLVGTVISVGAGYVAQWANMFVFIMLLATLVVRPRGIFNEGRLILTS